MKTIKELIALNDAHTIQLCTTPDYVNTGKINLYSIISSYKYAIRLISDTKDDICIYTDKNINIQQAMDIPVDIDRRFNILVTQDV